VHKEDAFNVVREVVGIYYYIFNYYVKPAASTARVDAQAVTETVKEKINSATQKVEDKGRDPDVDR
jgi:hypothetical protein